MYMYNYRIMETWNCVYMIHDVYITVCICTTTEPWNRVYMIHDVYITDMYTYRTMETWNRVYMYI